ncbi:MAG TPA: type I-B CRISPR-associated protein Cas5b [Thermodesulfobacteriota bacterium]|nr:type I-B CRISPR-associated protein Cas5b [Thermodesulfobacteriota bacterium]
MNKESTTKALRIRIYQPQAHYRVPFTYQRRHTYPIPPYSTVIGLLCNVLGIRNLKTQGEPKEDANYKKLKELKISIAGRFESKTTEYTWLRNLSKDSHIIRFGSTNIREINGHIEHIGGQSPVLIDILSEVKLFIYLANNDEVFLKKIKTSLENPTQRLYPIHLGRAEDWIVFEEISSIFELEYKEKIQDGNYRNFFWIPKHYVRNGQTPGLRYRVPTFYKLTNGVRNFEYEDAFLNDGKIIGLKGYFDEFEENNVKIRMPVFFSGRRDNGSTT